MSSKYEALQAEQQRTAAQLDHYRREQLYQMEQLRYRVENAEQDYLVATIRLITYETMHPPERP